MKYSLFILSVSAKVLYKSLSNYSGKRLLKTQADCHQLNFYITALCFALFTCLAIGNEISLFSVCLGILFGVMTLVNNVYGLLAFSKGPMNITDLIVTSSMLIPAISGVILFDEEFSVLKSIATLFLIFFLQLSIRNTKVGAKVNKRWIFYCLITFLSQGAIGVMQKIHQNSIYKNELFGFLAVAFLISMLSSGFAAGRQKKEERRSEWTKRHYLVMLIQGVCMFLMHFLNLKLSGLFTSQLFYPVSAGSGILLVLLISVVIFKEKLTKKQIVGLAGGFISIIGICMF